MGITLPAAWDFGAVWETAPPNGHGSDIHDDNMKNTPNKSFLHGKSFTLRLEHRSGGVAAMCPGEERFLLFRSDEPGAIAKIIFSIGPYDGKAVKAKVHALNVKSNYRGKDLGGLLFVHAMDALVQRHGNVTVDCQLEAEENMRRFDRLIQFYKELGCEVKPKAKIQYLNNNDGDTYRKVPMRIFLNNKNGRIRHKSILKCFLPIQFLEITGHHLLLDLKGKSLGRQLAWLLVDSESGFIQFRTTMGHYLRAKKSGNCDITNEPDCDSNFFLYRVSDEEFDSDILCNTNMQRKELWVIESIHGNFLSTNLRSISCSITPSFWQADDETLSLTYTTDTPLKRCHYRLCWTKQTLDYVKEMRKRYLNFSLAKMTIREVIDLVRSVRCHPYNMQTTGASIRSLSFYTAEKVRKAGLPDWVQLVALIHNLGVVISLIDAQTASDAEDGYNWTIASRSRVVGCAAPDRASFSEFRNLNAEDQYYPTPQGIYDLHCGLENALLSWSGPEYMYNCMKHNKALFPDEGFAMLRYFCLGDWHTHDEYKHLTNEEDEIMKTFVSEFDSLRRSAVIEIEQEIPESECDSLWEGYYSLVVEKYGLEGLLAW
eukprot:CAMPEP_0194204542 /NCGR_PEP_ID=MMETSP0156-20130528/4033_1 /TAXON_ID=33649 /ORGANISM="Thalassionema nitzschioides, Strain L26-B" /LENGTH=598 /DNA_ID=CAMNT_0038930585 /DNA_START=127 /DNA_END=1924 /DNA_ORIENTATION=-